MPKPLVQPNCICLKTEPGESRIAHITIAQAPSSAQVTALISNSSPLVTLKHLVALAEHFELNGARINALTDIGDVTVRILEFNNINRLLEREALREVGRYPSAQALALIQRSNA